jgi:hypothetical protein
MGRKQKHPEHADESQRLMNELLDMTVQVWTEQENPELKAIAEEIELSPAKLRKLLITASIRDNETYFSSPTADTVLKLQKDGKSVKEIQEMLGLSYTSVQGYLPHKSVYGLDTMSAECERIRLYRRRRKAVEELNIHLGLPDQSVYLWKAVVAFQSYPFTTSGRGNRPGVKFTYEVSEAGGAGGKHYSGVSVDGYGNELWIIRDGQRAEKSISRSTVDLALRTALEKEIKGPKALGIPGAGSYLYPLLVRFGVIEKAHSEDE